jgi:nucleoside-diphosphate-sugar epimerase
VLSGSPKNKEAFARYANEPGVRIVWGDLSKATRAAGGRRRRLRAATGGDDRPAATIHPQQARRSNYEGTVNLVEAIKKHARRGAQWRFVNVCTVAGVRATGCRAHAH